MVPAPKDTPLHHPVTSSQVVFRGAVWDVREDVIDYPGGGFSRHYVDHPGASCVVALDDGGNVVLLEQYRHPVRSRNVEIPAGLLDSPGEDPLECAKRELIEEAGFTARTWEHMVTLNVSPGGSNEVIHMYLARGLTPVSTDFVKTHEEADMEVLLVPLEEAVAAIRRGDISNQIAVTALLMAHDRLT